MAKKYYKVYGVVECDDADWSENADEVFSIATCLMDYPEHWWTGYQEITLEQFNSHSRILTPEGGV